MLVLRPCRGEPELVDPAITGQFAPQMAALAETEQVAPWCSYVAWQEDVPVGCGGFVAAPDPDGCTEIGYLTFPAHEGRGVARTLAASLVAIAAEAGAKSIVAHTLPVRDASTTVLEHNGFRRAGEAEDPDEGTVWRWLRDLSGD